MFKGKEAQLEIPGRGISGGQVGIVGCEFEYSSLEKKKKLSFIGKMKTTL